MKLVVAAVALLAPAVSHADALRVATADYDEPAPMPPGMTPVIVVDPAPVVVDQVPDTRSTIAKQTEIVASQRHFLSGTALTVPQGRVEIAGKSALVVNGASIAAGLTSTTEVWADVYAVIEEGGVFGAGLKQVLARGNSWQLAATASIRGGGDGGDTEKIGSVGGILTACTDDCTAMVSGGVQVLFADDEDEALPIYTGGFSLGSATTRLVGELMYGQENGDGGGIGYAGVRFGSRKYAIDLGLIRLFEDDGDELPAWPLLSIAGRM